MSSILNFRKKQKRKDATTQEQKEAARKEFNQRVTYQWEGRVRL